MLTFAIAGVSDLTKPANRCPTCEQRFPVRTGRLLVNITSAITASDGDFRKLTTAFRLRWIAWLCGDSEVR